MDLQDFRTGLLNDVEARAESEGDYTLTAFVAEASVRLSEAEAVEDLEPLHFRGTGRHGRSLGIDGYDIGDSDGSVTLAIALFSGVVGEAPRLGPSEAKRGLEKLQAFLEEAISGDFTRDREPSAREVALALDLRGLGRSPSRYRLILLTDHLLSDRAMQLPISSINGIPIDYQVWDVRRFWDVEESARGREELVIDLTPWKPDGLEVLKVVGDAGFTTYLTAVPATMLADLYAEFGSRLLESNVRSYLSARGKINKGIQTTILTQPGMFLAYNNGITATATGVSGGVGVISAISDLQIVNGGQTTASLFYVRRDGRGERASLEGVHVQMKLVVVAPEDANEVVPNISRYANSQNRVSEADFFSNSPFHVRLEELSRHTLAPQLPGHQYQTRWYYERTRGQYMNECAKLGAAERRRFDLVFPRTQVITKTDAARYDVAWSQRPHQVSAGAQRNFMAFAESVAKRWADAPDEFNEEYFRDLVSKAILYQRLRQAVSKQSWYQQGYLANIVAYAMAKVSWEISRQAPGCGMNFRMIWDRQDVPKVILSQFLIAARAALAGLTSRNRPIENVTEWAKREQAWVAFKGDVLRLEMEFKGTLLDPVAVQDRRSSAKAKQKTDSGIAQQVAVMAIPASEWFRLSAFVRDHRLGTEAQRGIVGKLAEGRLIPTERQVSAVASLLEAAKAKGWVGEAQA